MVRTKGEPQGQNQVFMTTIATRRSLRTIEYDVDHFEMACDRAVMIAPNAVRNTIFAMKV